MTNPRSRAARGSSEQTETVGPTLTIPRPTDESDERPYCHVVGAYCECAGWVQRELSPAAVACCRHYWAEAVGR